ncbi:MULTISPECIES: hypothetical protein [Cellulomonas]|nr:MULTISPECIES: hypothetical protein [Cellulomonas]
MALFLVLAVLGVVALAVALARAVRADGLGHRPPPPSRHVPFGGRAW